MLGICNTLVGIKRIGREVDIFLQGGCDVEECVVESTMVDSVPYSLLDRDARGCEGQCRGQGGPGPELPATPGLRRRAREGRAELRRRSGHGTAHLRGHRRDAEDPGCPLQFPQAGPLQGIAGGDQGELRWPGDRDHDPGRNPHDCLPHRRHTCLPCRPGGRGPYHQDQRGSNEGPVSFRGREEDAGQEGNQDQPDDLPGGRRGAL